MSEKLIEAKQRAINAIMVEAHRKIARIEEKAIAALDIVANTSYALGIEKAKQKNLVKEIIELALFLKTPLNSPASNKMLMDGKRIYAAILRSHYQCSIEEIAMLVYNNKYNRENVHALFATFNNLFETDRAFHAKFYKCINLCRDSQVIIDKPKKNFKIK